MAWRIAKSLETLREQVNEKWPNRRKDNDGTIGDAAHASRTSDHNPWIRDAGTGVVTAMDITHDPASGCDSYAIAEHLRLVRDPRIKYIISNRKIASFDHGWTWRPYSGKNPHDHHVHISVRSEKALYDDARTWDIALATGATDNTPLQYVPPPPTLRKGSTGPAVEELQKILKIHVDGDFGVKTYAAVRNFQFDHDLKADGVVGPLTWKALKKGK